MKNMKLLLIVWLLSSLSWGMIDVNEAMQKVREFDANPNLQLEYLGVDQDLSDEERFGIIPPLPWPCYFFTTAPGSEVDRSYIVEPYTGQVVFWRDEKRDSAVWDPERSYEFGRVANQMITPQQAYNLAINFIQTHDPAFVPNDYEVLVYDEQIDETGGVVGGYKPYNPDMGWGLYQRSILLSFRKKLFDTAGDIIIFDGDSCEVELDSESGQVVSYQRRNFPLNITLNPDISQSEAEEIALSAFNQAPFSGYVNYAEIKGIEKEIIWVNVPPNCFAYVWVIEVNTYTADQSAEAIFGSLDDPQGWQVKIDAHTGEVYSIERYMGAVQGGVNPTEEKKKRFEKAKQKKVARILKLRINNEVSSLYPEFCRGTKIRNKVYIEKQQIWLFHVAVDDKGQSIVLKHDGKRYNINPTKVLRKNEKIYVLLDEVLKIAGYEAKYVPNENAIYIKKVNKEKEKVKGAIGGTLSLSALSYALWKFLRILA